MGTKPDEKLALVSDSDIWPAGPFGLALVKRYLPPEDISRSLFADLRDSFKPSMSPSASATFLAEIIEPNYPRANS